MFEQINYSFSFTSIGVALVYFFYINLNFLLFATTGLFAEKVTKIKIPSVIKILVGYALYTSLAWWLYKTGNSKIIFSTFISLVLCFAVYLLIKIKREKLAYRDIFMQMSSNLKNLTPLFVIELVLILIWAGFLNDNPYHILAYGNNDVYFWGLMSDHIMGISNIERITESWMIHVMDCFGVYSWLGLIGQLSMKGHSIEAVMLFQLSLSILLAWLIYEISVVVVGVHRFAAFVPAFVFSFNPLWVYVFTNNFLSQMVATFCFLSSIYIVGSSISLVSSIKNIIVTSFLLYVCFVFSYPGLLMPYIAVVLGMMVTFIYFVSRAKSASPWYKIAMPLAGATGGLVLGAILFYDMTSWAISRLTVLSSIAAGWPLSMLDPRNLIGLISYSLDHTHYANWYVYLLLIALIVFVFILRNRGGKEQTLLDARYDSLLFLSLMSLIAYLGVYYIKGDSYQQWKFATYFPLPLLLLAGVNYFAPKNHV